MNLYLDTSALVKLYIHEQGTDEVNHWIAQAAFTATSLITLAEANAALGRASRLKFISQGAAEDAIRLLRRQWLHYLKTPITEKTVARAAELAWNLGLRGYDAVHLASAELWQAALGLPVVLVTYDVQLAEGGRMIGMELFPSSGTLD